jgi:hypothetical protein
VFLALPEPGRTLKVIGSLLIIAASASVAVWLLGRRERATEVATPPPETARFAAPPTPAPSAAPPSLVFVVPPHESVQIPYANLSGYQGATVEAQNGQTWPWAFSYAGPSDILFRILALDRYDPERGFVRAQAAAWQKEPVFHCRHDCIHARIVVATSSEPLILPLPTGFSVDSQSVRFRGVSVAPVLVNPLGEAAVLLPAGSMGAVEYVVGPGPAGPKPAVSSVKVNLPDWANTELAAVSKLPLRKKVEHLTRVVRDRIAYDVSPSVARAYATSTEDWLTRVLHINAGDCDVKNGLNVVLLRSAGVTARLAIGISGHQGRTRPGLHAWTEFYQNGWHAIDATGSPERHSRALPTLALRVTEPAVALPTDRTAVAPPRAAPVALEEPAADASSSQTPRGESDERPQSPAKDSQSLSSLMSSCPRCADSLSPHAVHVPLRLWILLAAAAFAIGAWGVRRAHVAETWVASGSREDAQRALATVLMDALVNPQGWHSGSDLWRRKLLPTLAGPPLSMAQAAASAAAGRLFFSRQHRELAKLASRCGTRVLDAADPIFGNVVVALGRGTDLDAIDALKPLSPSEVQSEMASAQAQLRPVNDLLSKTATYSPCHICPFLTGAAVQDVDLSAVALPHRAPWPRRYIAVNPHHSEVKEQLALLRDDPTRAVLVWIDWLCDRSLLLKESAPRLRELAATQFLEAQR